MEREPHHVSEPPQLDAQRESKFLDEITPEINIRIEDEKISDEEVKESIRQRYIFTQEYLECIEKLLQIPETNVGENVCKIIMDKLSNKTKEIIDKVYETCVLKEIEQIIVRLSTKQKLETKEEESPDLLAYQHTPIQLLGVDLGNEDIENLEPYLNNQYLRKLLVYSQKCKVFKQFQRDYLNPWFDVISYAQIQKDYMNVKMWYNKYFVWDPKECNHKDNLTRLRERLDKGTNRILIESSVADFSTTVAHAHMIDSHFYESQESKMAMGLSKTPRSSTRSISDLEESKEDFKGEDRASLFTSAKGHSPPNKRLLTPLSSVNKSENKKQEITQISIKDAFLNNCFLKLSEFANILGMKILLQVDWDYLTSRNWEITHTYLKTSVYEAIMASGLSNELVSDTDPNSPELNKAIDSIHSGLDSIMTANSITK